MQNAAIKKARELGFDLAKGEIPLEETLINLSNDRDILLDAYTTKKLEQLPHRLQRALRTGFSRRQPNIFLAITQERKIPRQE